MDTSYCKIIISATSKQEADRISDMLIHKKLIAGSLILNGPSRYWWENKIVEKEYYNIQAFSVFRHKEAVIMEVKQIHTDKCPIIAFLPLDGNQEFLKWIEESVQIFR